MGIHIDPDVLRTAGAQLDAAAGDFGSQLGQLQSTVTSDNPWGADEAGSAFGLLYTAVLGHAVEAMASTTASTRSDLIATSILIFGRKLTVYSAAR